MKAILIFLTTMISLLRSVRALRLPMVRICSSSSALQSHASSAATSIGREKHGQTYRLYASTEIASSIGDKAGANEESIFDIDLPTNEDSEDLLRIRHSTAHVMAMAVQQVHPDAKVTIGPWIDNGYDIVLKYYLYCRTCVISITRTSIYQS